MMKLYVFHADKRLYITFKYGDDILKKIIQLLYPSQWADSDFT